MVPAASDRRVAPARRKLRSSKVSSTSATRRERLTLLERRSSVPSRVDSSPERSSVAHVLPPSGRSSELDGGSPREVLDLRSGALMLMRRVDLRRVEGDGFGSREGIPRKGIRWSKRSVLFLDVSVAAKGERKKVRTQRAKGKSRPAHLFTSSPLLPFPLKLSTSTGLSVLCPTCFSSLAASDSRLRLASFSLSSRSS